MQFLASFSFIFVFFKHFYRIKTVESEGFELGLLEKQVSTLTT